MKTLITALAVTAILATSAVAKTPRRILILPDIAVRTVSSW